MNRVPENYNNLKIIYEKLKLDDYISDFKMSADFKVINIVTGIQSTSTTFSCPYGTCKKPTKKSNEWEVGEDRTIE